MSIKGFLKTITVVAALTFLVTAFGGCAALNMAENLPGAMENHDDPQTVAEALPTLLLIADSLVISSPDDEDYLVTASQLYTSYAAAFVDDPDRALTLTQRADEYADRALCLESDDACGLIAKPAAEVEAIVAGMGKAELPYLYNYAVCRLLWMSVRSGDWGAILGLPKVQYMLERVVALDDSYKEGSAHMYLGVLTTLRPPSLGGKPEIGKAHFERAIELSGGTDLTVKVEYAKRYARLVYDRELHDKLLGEVMEAPAKVPGKTLTNTLAKRTAAKLLKSAEDYF